MEHTAYFQVMDMNVSFGTQSVVNQLNFGLQKGEIGCLLGFSGCGKTTALRAIAGLENIQQGKIYLNQRLLSDQQHLTEPAKRGMGMVFQDYALFAHLTVAQNVGFGLRHLKKSEQQNRIDEMLHLVELSQHAKKRPDQLSGGQQQRIALARALAPKPELLLLDEPFSNLDVVLRESLATKVREMIKQSNTTAILVTHDQQEAFAMADKIGVMQGGKLVQFASASQLYHHPKNAFIANFICEGVLLNAQIHQNHIQTALGHIPTENRTQKSIKLLLRPNAIHYQANSQIQATIIHKVFRGENFLYQLQLTNGEVVLALISSEQEHPIGSQIGIKADLQKGVIIETDEK